MPTYEYRCQNCGHQFEELQKITDDPIDTCPKCSGKVERLIFGGTGLIFKGSGFYITDYKSNGNGSSVNGSSKTESEPAKKSDTSSTSND
jgi:putative FmdB family regulatory protein